MVVALAEAYLHQLDPYAIRFPEGWPLGGLRWYGLSYLAGFVLGWLIIRWLARTHRTTIPPAAVPDLMVAVLLGVILGGRLGYCLFYDRSLLFDVSGSFPWWGLLAINRGGMASHGGMIGVIVALWIFARRHGLSKLHLFDVAAFACPPGLFLGRLANFVNGELVGRPAPEGLPWAMKFSQELHYWGAGQLAQPSMTGLVREHLGVPAGEWQAALLEYGAVPASTRFVNGTIERVVGAVQRGNAEVIEALRPLLELRHPSQLYQALSDGPLLMAILCVIWMRPRKPGVVGASFLGSYGAMRLVTELFREPDPGVRVLSTPLGELSRGQQLSLAMVLAGVVGLIICARREVEPIGGLRSPS